MADKKSRFGALFQTVDAIVETDSTEKTALDEVPVSSVATTERGTSLVKELETEIEQLRSEIEELNRKELDPQEKQALEQKVAELTQKLAEQGGEQEVAIDLIDRDPNQPRTVFAKGIIQARAESLQRNGQQTPIILVPLDNGRFRLFDGEIRWRSAKKIQWATLRSVFLPLEKVGERDQVFKQQVITSKHAETLHDLDLAHAIVRIVSQEYADVDQEHIPTILSSALRRLERTKEKPEFKRLRIASVQEQAAWLEQAKFNRIEERQIFKTLLELQLHPESVNKHVFPLLKLSEDLVELVREEGLESAKVRSLHRLSAENLNCSEAEAMTIRSEVAQMVIAQDLSLKQVDALVAEWLAKTNPNSSKATIVQRLVKTVQAVNVDELDSVDDLKTLLKALRVKTSEVQDAIKAKNQK